MLKSFKDLVDVLVKDHGEDLEGFIASFQACPSHGAKAELVAKHPVFKSSQVISWNIPKSLEEAEKKLAALDFSAGNLDEWIMDLNEVLALVPHSENNLFCKTLLTRAELFNNCGMLKEAREDVKLVSLRLHLVTESEPDLRSRIEKLKVCLEGKSVDPEDGNPVNKEVFGGLHQHLKGCSAALELRYDQEKGRCMIATKDIPAGVVLVVEKPYASVLMLQKITDHCYTCKRHLMMYQLFCSKCAKVRFCSMACQKAAKTHSIECQYMGNLLNEDDITPAGHLAHEIILQTGWSVLKSLRDSIGTSGHQQAPVKDLGIRYHDVYNLANNESSWDPRLSFQACLVAVYLATLLRQSGFFQKGEDEVPMDDFIFLVSLLYNHMLNLKCNRVGLVETQYKTGAVDGPMEAFGRAVCGTLSMFNHSCAYGCCIDYIGDHLVVHTLVPFQAGQEVTINYGFNYAQDNLVYRQQRLSSLYAFECQCIACKEDWPTVANVAQTIFKCPKCSKTLSSSKCSQCGSVAMQTFQQLQDYQKIIQKARVFLRTGLEKGPKAAVLAAEYINLMYPMMHPRSVDLVMAISNLRTLTGLAANLALDVTASSTLQRWQPVVHPPPNHVTPEVAIAGETSQSQLQSR
ncbi:unnamed protein product [Notodromas monacha]|uniref:SET domain-containing protein n=1 Tax=Notodromas monacha TaxID=399045 RepID=A0A7R9BI11_9CRUS|nr:unnamed protein product [Notodromas monacha]CAG0915589.1 unnamed protein product [Notodromas monacha]